LDPEGVPKTGAIFGGAVLFFDGRVDPRWAVSFFPEPARLSACCLRGSGGSKKTDEQVGPIA